MRILAIRGQNLASLAEEFEVDLAGGPLAGAGLFAITGPTGAGKSTLLDALCLALFDRAPRLGGRRDMAMIGRDEITSIAAHDVRSLVRRGATSGWAEVDFEGGDGRRYRARWSARRARQRIEGRFQDQQMTLVCVDTGEKLGGTRTETLDAIRAKLGLSFDQFRRSALLAQGDFAAFLRADAAERADLLERMTGTEIYGAVSIAAFQRAKELAGIARAREDELLRVAVMDAEARAAADDAAVRAADDATAAAEHLRAVEAAAAWTEARAALVAAVAGAESDEGAARGAVGAASDDRARVARMEAAESVRAPWEARAKAHEEERRATAAVAIAEAARRAAEIGLGEASAVDDEARNAAAAVPATAAAAAAATASASSSALRTDLAVHLARVDDARRWMTIHAAFDAIAADWPRWQRALAREADAADAIVRARTDEDRLIAAVATAEARADEADGGRAAAAAALEGAQAMATAAEAKRGARPADLRRALEALGKRADGAARLVGVTTSARAAADDATANHQRAAEARGRAIAADAIRAGARTDEDTATAALREAERAADRLRLAAGLAHERAALVDGEPCPLCGADAHPWAGRGALDEIVVEQEGRVSALRAQVRAAQGRGAAAIAEARAATDDAETATRAARDAAASQVRATEQWRTALADLGELPLVDDPATDAAAQLAAERAAAAAQARDKARVAVELAEKIDSDAGHAQQIALARRADLDHAQTDAFEAAQAVARLGAQLAAARRELADAGKVRDAAREDLAPALGAWPGWRDRLDRERARVTAELERGALDWRDRAAAIAAAARAVAALRDQAAALRLASERTAAAAGAARTAATDSLARARTARTAADAALAAARDALALAPLTDDELAALLGAGPGAAARVRARLAELDRRAAEAAAVLAERRRTLLDHDLARPAAADGTPAPDHARHAARAAADRARDAALALHLDDDARARRAVAAAALDDARATAQPFEILRDLIGSADGKAFRAFAQGLTLDALLVGANAHLDQLAPRYQLERVPRSDLDLQVVDRDLGDDVRSVQSLSGGESFLVSLALALALSSLSAHDVRVRTLLIDEGFGTLDPAALDVALAVLDALQASGRQVGIISHVPGLAERVGAQVAVRPVGSGKSVVRVRAAS